MKKLLSILFAVLLIPTAALASGLDLSAYTTEELKALRSEITAEIFEREYPVEQSFINDQLVYFVGEDLPAGDYWIEPAYVSKYRTTLYIYSQKSIYLDAKLSGVYASGTGASEKIHIDKDFIGSPVKISLREGNVLYITDYDLGTVKMLLISE